MSVVTFDFGQTLAELDTVFLAARVSERGAVVSPERLDLASASAWSAYDDAKARGKSGYDAWSTFMLALLSGAGVRSILEPERDVTRSLVDFLWSEQPKKNLWRRPIEGMEEVVGDLIQNGVRLAIISNSEGKLEELLEEMGLRRYFVAVADSGKLGIEKPDARIFEWTAERLGVPANALVHVGDAWVADVEGALGVGARAVWIQAEARGEPLPTGVLRAGTADALRSALRAFGVPA
jgi:putative hydrolase of the HAD superfamily